MKAWGVCGIRYGWAQGLSGLDSRNTDLSLPISQPCFPPGWLDSWLAVMEEMISSNLRALSCPHSNCYSKRGLFPS